MKFGEFVKKYREEHSLSQRSFAKRCNVSNGYISMIEKGENPKTHEPIKPQLEMLRSISSGMGMTVHELLLKIDDIDLDISMPEKPAAKNEEMPAPESGMDEFDRQLLAIIKTLGVEQKQFLLAQLQTLQANRAGRE